MSLISPCHAEKIKKVHFALILIFYYTMNVGRERKGERREARTKREEERRGARREREVERREGGGCTEEAEQSRFLTGFLACHPPPRDESLVI